MRKVGGAHRSPNVKFASIHVCVKLTRTLFIRMATTITTNSVPRECIMGMYLWGSLKQELRAQFDYLTPDEFDEMEFFKYKGHWYSIGDFMCIESSHPFSTIQWDGYSSDSYFSGVLMKYCYDGTVIVGSYYS